MNRFHILSSVIEIHVNIQYYWKRILPMHPYLIIVQMQNSLHSIIINVCCSHDRSCCRHWCYCRVRLGYCVNEDFRFPDSYFLACSHFLYYDNTVLSYYIHQVLYFFF